MIRLALLSLILLATPTLRAEEFDLNGHGIASVEIPQGWTATSTPTTRPDKGEIGCTITLTAPGDLNARGLITCLYVKQEAPSKEGVINFLHKNSDRMAAKSVEKKITPQDFTLKQGFGVYSLFTDPDLVGKPPQKDNFKVMASGIIQQNQEILCVISLFTDDPQGKDFQALLQAINSLTLIKAAKGPTI